MAVPTVKCPKCGSITAREILEEKYVKGRLMRKVKCLKCGHVWEQPVVPIPI